ncbi:hypothetical protein C8E89_13157 [Mycolicibacterium moriokaense]|jgi:hypothetical protein|uniref:Uncharacterized protein n=1 Tax=Mycolicibacterium moriokaense TaxID=39691 RepID=A0A318HFB4_9MYCO|nr:hypothetical protein C8E89_13157 [Mycolicibacterium moriokaense]
MPSANAMRRTEILMFNGMDELDDGDVLTSG